MNSLKFGMNGGKKHFLTCLSAAGLSSVAQQTASLGGLCAALTGPSVRRLLESYGLQSHSIQASGHKGQLLKGDVLKYIHDNAKIQLDFIAQPKNEEISIAAIPSPVLEAHPEYTDIGLSSARQTIAKIVTESKTTIPHVYSTVDCNVENIYVHRKKLKQNGIVVSVNDFIIKAASLALGRVPVVNSYWSENGPVTLNAVNIAVALASQNGLVTPVINNVNELDVQSISLAVRELSIHANKGQLQPHQLQGGTFTISNLGMFGIKHFTAVIYPPQTGILAVGQPQVCYNEFKQKLTKVMTVTLCCDGRVIDEEHASMWLKEFQEIIENPIQMGL